MSDLIKGPSWEVLENFERFNQVNDVFNRAFWDSEIATDGAREFFRSHREPLKKWRNASGFEQRDYAIRNAAWHVADVFAEMRDADDLRDGFLSPLSQLRPGPEEGFDLGSPNKLQKLLSKYQNFLARIWLVFANLMSGGFIPNGTHEAPVKENLRVFLSVFQKIFRAS